MALAEPFPHAGVAAAVVFAAVAAIVFLCVRLRQVIARARRSKSATRRCERASSSCATSPTSCPPSSLMSAAIAGTASSTELYGAWFRCSSDEVVGKKIDDVLGPETMKFAGEYIDWALRGEEVHFQPEVQYPAGPRWVDAHYVPDFDASGQVAGFCVLVLDVTQRKLAEDAVRQSEARLWAILDHLSVGVGLVDGEGRMILGNSTMRGYVPERIPSRDPARIHRWRIDGDAIPPRAGPPSGRCAARRSAPGWSFLTRATTGATSRCSPRRCRFAGRPAR